MTYNGGKPHQVGDQGQRYEVTFFDPDANVRRVFGWCANLEAARRMADSVEKHPSWGFPWITDRKVPKVE